MRDDIKNFCLYVIVECPYLVHRWFFISATGARSNTDFALRLEGGFPYVLATAVGRFCQLFVLLRCFLDCRKSWTAAPLFGYCFSLTEESLGLSLTKSKEMMGIRFVRTTCPLRKPGTILRMVTTTSNRVFWRGIAAIRNGRAHWKALFDYEQTRCRRSKKCIQAFAGRILRIVCVFGFRGRRESSINRSRGPATRPACNRYVRLTIALSRRPDWRLSTRPKCDSTICSATASGRSPSPRGRIV